MQVNELCKWILGNLPPQTNTTYSNTNSRASSSLLKCLKFLEAEKSTTKKEQKQEMRMRMKIKWCQTKLKSLKLWPPPPILGWWRPTMMTSGPWGLTGGRPSSAVGQLTKLVAPREWRSWRALFCFNLNFRVSGKYKTLHVSLLQKICKIRLAGRGEFEGW